MCGGKLYGSGLSTAGYLRIAEGKIRRESETLSAVFYITDALRMLTENMANLSGGRYIRTAFSDSLTDHSYMTSLPDTLDNGEEIIGHIREKLRGKDNK